MCIRDRGEAGAEARRAFAATCTDQTSGGLHRSEEGPGPECSHTPPLAMAPGPSMSELQRPRPSRSDRHLRRQSASETNAGPPLPW
eukprot:12327843-Alexandrium_andersonii.AAC.1